MSVDNSAEFVLVESIGFGEYRFTNDPSLPPERDFSIEAYRPFTEFSFLKIFLQIPLPEAYFYNSADNTIGSERRFQMDPSILNVIHDGGNYVTVNFPDIKHAGSEHASSILLRDGEPYLDKFSNRMEYDDMQGNDGRLRLVIRWFEHNDVPGPWSAELFLTGRNPGYVVRATTRFLSQQVAKYQLPLWKRVLDTGR